ncbi:MAG: glycosyltransferase family 4 protein, partial [Coriobacteriia bacterium]|nr:glycosyltransferase family 4 protein [Coriobacteriia bacterium]
RSLCRLVKDFRPDVVQANGSETLKYVALLRLRYPRVRAIYRNISIMSMWSDSGLKQRLVGAALRRMDHVASVTQVGKGDLVNGFGVAEDRVSVIPIGVHVPPDLSLEEREQVRDNVRRRFGLPVGCPLVIHVGSFTPEKNHRELLQALARVAREVPASRLLLVGDGPLRPQIEEMVRDSGLEGSVVMAGVVPDAASLMAGADVLALPSLREGLPGVILEAAVAGVPVVAYDVGGVPEVVKDGVTGFVVAMGDVHGLVGRLAGLLADPMARLTLGKEARRRVESLYTLDRVTDRFEEAYLHVVERQ